MLAINKSGWRLLEYIEIAEEDLVNFNNVTGAFAILKIKEQYLIGYNKWRKQWEFPAGHIEQYETAREAAQRELYEETHQSNSNLTFRGLFKVCDANDVVRYQAVFMCEQYELEKFIMNEDDEMSEIMLWDMKHEIGYVDECDVKIVEMSCLQ